MCGNRRFRLLAAVVVLALLPAARAAAVEQLAVTPAGEVTAVSQGPITFTAGGYTITCNVTLTGSIEEDPLLAVVGNRAGTITGASISGCTNGAITAVLGLPLSIEYAGITGTLPSITSMQFTLDRLAFESTMLGLFRCLYSGAIRATLPLTGTNPSIGNSLRIDESSTFTKISGSEACPTTGRMSATYAFTREAVQLNPQWIVSVGDSYIGGEGGRWAGATVTLTQNEYAAMDALGPTAYFDNGLGNAERVPLCHRSRAAEAFIGGTVDAQNLACTGARAQSRWETETFGTRYWKPGLDFENQGANARGQALQLQEFVTEWRRAVRMVVISIGGNDFRFGYVVEQCLYYYTTFRYCSTRPELTGLFEPIAAGNAKVRIRQGLLNVNRAMIEGGLQSSEYRLLVQTYPSPLPEEGGRFRYPETNDRISRGGCGFYNLDAAWANATVLGTINRTISEAVAESGLTNALTMDLSTAFTGRRLCETTVGLLEERGLTEWRSAGAVDRTEWITQIRFNTLSGPFYRQEGFHPNYWGELALRNCVRQAYNAGTPRGGRCTIAGTGLNEKSPAEPRMRLE